MSNNAIYSKHMKKRIDDSDSDKEKERDKERELSDQTSKKHKKTKE
jgi:predicted DNA binding CopG/RHH family protein